jgi:uncharacterized protein
MKASAFILAFVALGMPILAVQENVARAELKPGPYVDIHFHADARKEGGGDLPKVAAWMKSNSVDRLIVLQFEKSMPQNEAEAKQIVENFKAYQGQIYRFTVLLAKDVPDKETAVKTLKKEKEQGVIGFGEHYGRGLNFDDPKCMQLYAACAEVGLPVLFHMDGTNNKDDDNLSHLENALKTYPTCVFIAHGPSTWGRMKAMDGLLAKYKNLYADISAGSGAKALSRDKAYSCEFLIRHADQVLFGTDGGPWSFGQTSSPHFELVKSLNLPIDVHAKLCRENAEKLFKLGPQQKIDP